MVPQLFPVFLKPALIQSFGKGYSKALMAAAVGEKVQIFQLTWFPSPCPHGSHFLSLPGWGEVLFNFLKLVLEHCCIDISFYQ